MNYTTAALVEKYLTIDIDAAFESEVTKWGIAMSRLADKHCNRTLVTDVSETRKFSGIGSQTLHIDEVNNIIEVTDKDATAIVDYIEYPLNKAHVQAIMLEGGIFEAGNANYNVEGYFAMHKDVIPDEVELAVTMLTAAIVSISRSGGDNVKSEKVGIYSYTMKDLEEKNDYKIAMQILDQFKKLAF